MTRSFRIITLSVVVFIIVGTCEQAIAQEDRSPEVTVQTEAAVQTEQVSTQQEAQPAIFHPAGQVISPETNFVRPEEGPFRAHTNVEIFVPQGRATSSILPDYTFAETPASMGCVYKVGTNFAGCNPQSGYKYHPAGGWGAIALVDAYDNPNAATDLALFSTYWGLPTANFTKVYANSSFGVRNGLTASCSGIPPANVGWGLEEDLDIQWAHAFAPAAKIILVEACSNSYNDLLYAEQVAGMKVQAAGGGAISNSWSGSEYSYQLGPSGWDNYFYRYYYDHITYFASAGDHGYGAAFPSTVPWVVSAGGTTINRDASGNFLSEGCWSGSGGGPSAYETWRDADLAPGGKNYAIYYGMGPWTDYQYTLFGGYPYSAAPRRTPDIALDADPNSGVWVYDTYGYGGWMIIGGTSLSSPALAGIINSANNRLGQTPSGGGFYSPEELNLLYSQLYTKTAYGLNFYDVTTGSNGVSAGVGYDQCTGIGTPRGKLGK